MSRTTSANAMDASRPTTRRAAQGILMPSIIKLLVIGTYLPLLRAAPTRLGFVRILEEEEPMPPDNPTLWIYLAVAVGLVLLGGAFAGLTIALMGQDEIYLEVIKTSGDGAEKKHAARVLRLLKRGKHWVLVTLLLGNVITNETLPIVLDRSLGGGWPAVLGSTVLIVIFGEIIPQSICVRYGLPIGAWMSPLVLILMYIFAPVAWPTAKLLDWLLGEDHGTTYKKAGLKTLVTLHKSLGSAGEQLNHDEVTIISAVLDLKEKPVRSIMTPMDDVFTMSADEVLDEDKMDNILSAGYSRIPIHAPDNPLNFIGMLLVKILITYDPEDCKPVRDFALATLPETWPETSCLDIINFFQEGKSHMVLVSEQPGKDSGAIGVVTLEDVIEELIGEEIIDESDVFVDIHKAIRRIAPAPKYRVPKHKVVTDPVDNAAEAEENLIDVGTDQKPKPEAVRRYTTIDAALNHKPKNGFADISSSPKNAFNMRRTSSTAGVSDRETSKKRGDTPEMREHLKHLGPSNLASRPRQTRYKTVTIKPGAVGMGDLSSKKAEPTATPSTQSLSQVAHGGVGEGLLSSAGKDAKDGVQAVQAGYGSINGPRSPKSPDKGTRTVEININNYGSSNRSENDRRDTEESQSTIGSLPERDQSHSRVRRSVRSGSITENIIDSNGVKKVVLEMTSSSSETDRAANRDSAEGSGDDPQGPENDKPDHAAGGKGSKKKRRRKRKKGPSYGEDTPLLDRQ